MTLLPMTAQEVRRIFIKRGVATYSDGEGASEDIREKCTRMPKMRAQARINTQIWHIPVQAVLPSDSKRYRVQKV